MGVANMTTSAASYRMTSDDYAAGVEGNTARPNLHSGAVQTLAQNIAFTVARSKYNISRTSMTAADTSPSRSEFGRGYAMDYFLSLRKHSRRLNCAHHMKSWNEKDADMNTLYEQDTHVRETPPSYHESMAMIKEQQTHDFETSLHAPFSTDVKEMPTTPPRSSRPARARSFSSKSIYRSVSQSRRKQSFKKEVLKTVTVEVQTTLLPTDASRPETAASNSTSVSFVTLIWSTSLKSRCQDDMDPHLESDRIYSDEKEVVDEKPAVEPPPRLSLTKYKDGRNSKSALNLNSGWIAPDWDASFRAVGAVS